MRPASRWCGSPWPPTCSTRRSTAAACAGCATKEASRRRSRATTRARSSARTSRKARSASCSAAVSPRCAGASMRRTAGANFRCSTSFRTKASPTTWRSQCASAKRIRLGVGEGITASWTTDAPRWLPDAEVELLAGIMPPLTLAIMLRTTHRDTRTLLTTYLGRHAADRVLAGNVVRGRAEPIRAVVWFSDLVGFTRISDNASADQVLALLNDYAQAQVEEIEAHERARAEVHRRRHPRDLPRRRHDASPARARSMPRPRCGSASPR